MAPHFTHIAQEPNQPDTLPTRSPERPLCRQKVGLWGLGEELWGCWGFLGCPKVLEGGTLCQAPCSPVHTVSGGISGASDSHPLPVDGWGREPKERVPRSWTPPTRLVTPNGLLVLAASLVPRSPHGNCMNTEFSGSPACCCHQLPAWPTPTDQTGLFVGGRRRRRQGQGSEVKSHLRIF